METLSILINAILLVGLGLVLTDLGKDRFDKLERDTQRQFAGMQANMQQRFAEVDQRFTGIDQRFDDVHQRFDEVRQDISELRSEISVLRSDVTHIALAVGARHRPNTG